MADDKTTQPSQEAPEVAEVAEVPTAGSPTQDRRQSSDEWDAAKVPPSRFQKRKGSIYATPGSRDGHVDTNTQKKFHEKHAEKGYTKTK